jgi:hypothetical protein
MPPIASASLRLDAFLSDVRHDQMVLGVDSGLHIVADHTVPRPLVAIERASGSVSQTCWSGAA